MEAETGPHQVADNAAVHKDLSKRTTKICPGGFNITWGGDNRYWHIIKLENLEVAELKQVSWLEVTCSTDNVKCGEKYNVGFHVSLRPDAFGWSEVDVYVMAKVGKSGKFTPMKVSLGDKPPNDEPITIPEKPLQINVNPGTPVDQTTIHLGMYEVWSSKWKGGLRIHDAFINRI